MCEKTTDWYNRLNDIRQKEIDKITQKYDKQVKELEAEMQLLRKANFVTKLEKELAKVYQDNDVEANLSFSKDANENYYVIASTFNDKTKFKEMLPQLIKIMKKYPFKRVSENSDQTIGWL